jgi:type I thyroxine 5'-deiodinase
VFLGCCQASKYLEENAKEKKLKGGTPVPLVLDNMENEAEFAYSAHPERLYVLDADGTIAYKGGMGPFDYKPEELDEWLSKNE